MVYFGNRELKNKRHFEPQRILFYLQMIRRCCVKFPRYKENPFLENMEVPVKAGQVRVSPMGQGDDVLVNQSTGEVKGTHVTTYRKVDGEKFVKLFTANIALTFDLTSAGIKAFNVLMWSVQHGAISKDRVYLDSHTLADFMKAHDSKDRQLKLSAATFKRGINELERSQIVAKTIRQGHYFINPNFVFNGDRIAFTTLIERDSTEQKHLDFER